MMMQAKNPKAPTKRCQAKQKVEAFGSRELVLDVERYFHSKRARTRMTYEIGREQT